jgi:hypothetical protein
LISDFFFLSFSFLASPLLSFFSLSIPLPSLPPFLSFSLFFSLIAQSLTHSRQVLYHRATFPDLLILYYGCQKLVEEL